MTPLYEIRLAGGGDAEAIRAIRNHAVEHLTSMWTTKSISPDDGRAWLADHLARDAAYVADAGGEVIGFASWAPWRPKDGYRFTVENSVYVTAGHQGRGIGKALLHAAIAGAREAGAHVMIASIEARNVPSVGLHAALGFETVGTVREVGTKFGRWLDLTIMSLPL